MATLRLEQKRIGKGRQTFELRDAEEWVRVSASSHERGDEFKVSLETLSADYSRVRRRPFKPMMFAIIFGSAALLMAVAGANEPAAAFMAVPLGVIAAYCVFAWFRDSVDATVFFNRFSGAALLIIWNGQPTKTASEAFCEALAARAKKLEAKNASSPADSPADQLRKFSELLKDGIISEIEFAEIKSRLLALSEKREIGFHNR